MKGCALLNNGRCGTCWNRLSGRQRGWTETKCWGEVCFLFEKVFYLFIFFWISCNETLAMPFTPVCSHFLMFTLLSFVLLLRWGLNNVSSIMVLLFRGWDRWEGCFYCASLWPEYLPITPSWLSCNGMIIKIQLDGSHKTLTTPVCSKWGFQNFET